MTFWSEQQEMNLKCRGTVNVDVNVFVTTSSYFKKCSPVIVVQLGLYNRLCCIVEYTVLTEPITDD